MSLGSMMSEIVARDILERPRPHIGRRQLIVVGGLGLAIFAGCGTQIAVTRLKPAEISLRGVKQIAVTGVTGSDGLQLEGMLIEKIQASNRFVLVERSHLDKIRGELGLSSGVEFQEGNLAIGKLLPASALVWGRVDRSDFHEELKSEAATCSRIVTIGLKPKTQDYPCKHNERRGKGSVTVQFRVFDTATARILAGKTLSATEFQTARAENAEPASIDGADLKQKCLRTIAEDFIKVVAPFEVKEKVSLVDDSALPEIGQGNEYLKRGDSETAMEFYGKALAHANGDSTISLKSKAKASYAHALGSALVGDYPTAIKEMRAAIMMVQSSDWIDMEVRIKKWALEAHKVDEQRQAAEPPATPEGKSPAAETAGAETATGL
jgi:curli biogenesis system outer membrane secretion channel CsgG